MLFWAKSCRSRCIYRPIREQIWHIKWTDDWDKNKGKATHSYQLVRAISAITYVTFECINAINVFVIVSHLVHISLCISLFLFIPKLFKWHIHSLRPAMSMVLQVNASYPPFPADRESLHSQNLWLYILIIPCHSMREGMAEWISNGDIYKMRWLTQPIETVILYLECILPWLVKNYSPDYVFKRSWLQSEGNMWTTHDHIKRHFNILLQSGRVRAPEASADSKNNNFIHQCKY